ncbi:alginate export family protein [Motiliproteus sp. SC1-56]|uniref:alginate export family protein n=1 Tax=Motiliproteus sp. SC1-56 TaxID=2799565 RepID=UPI001A8C877D|nr:alginate export family protein [Motiliproteus sp. SC1-56]
MRTLKVPASLPLSIASCALLSLTLSPPTLAEDFGQAMRDSKLNLMLRYRFETVDQDGFSKDADASTLKTRVSLTTGRFYNVSATVEIDDVTTIGPDDYNDGSGFGKTEYPVVADPEGTDFNQLSLSYHSDGFTGTLGRQRINLNDQRFLGGAAWRQNEQTYEGLRLKISPRQKLELDLTYFDRVNRFFGPDSTRNSFNGDFFALNAAYKYDEQHRVAAYLYDLDFDKAVSSSSTSYGFIYDGQYDNFGIKAALALQEDRGDNPDNYRAEYVMLEAATRAGPVGLAAGYEQLGSDNGVSFQTPLGTLHKWQGFADKFLTTPADGIKDLYFKVSGDALGVKLAAIYHEFSAERGSSDYGSELDLVASYVFNEWFSGTLKYADYNADDFATDTEKFWAMVTFQF